MLKEQKRCLAGSDLEVLLNFRPLLTAKRRIGQDNVKTILLLNIAYAFSERVLVWTMFGASMPCKIMFMMPMT